MTNKFTTKASTRINAMVSDVWRALTDPAIIKEYLFGTDTDTDWKKGSKIAWKGVWQGKPYVDKGEIVEIVPGKLLHTTYLSGNSGKEDKPENYTNVIYELRREYGQTVVALSQDNIDNELQLQQMKQNWAMVLGGMKQLLEK